VALNRIRFGQFTGSESSIPLSRRRCGASIVTKPSTGSDQAHSTTRRCQARIELLDRDGNRNSSSLMPMTTAVTKIVSDGGAGRSWLIGAEQAATSGLFVSRLLFQGLLQGEDGVNDNLVSRGRVQHSVIER
jgi:hypothetical protein